MSDQSGKNFLSNGAGCEAAKPAGGQARPGVSPADALLPEFYNELRALAEHYLGGAAGARGLTIQPTVLVHEAYLRLASRASGEAVSKTHFFAVAATAVRHALLDYHKRRKRAKRGGEFERITLSALDPEESTSTVDFLALDDALERFRKLDARAAQVVDLRYFVGLTEPEIAEVLSVSERTVRSDWAMARAWLRAAMQDGAVPT